jgi:hypothetical protein
MYTLKNEYIFKKTAEYVCIMESFYRFARTLSDQQVLYVPPSYSSAPVSASASASTHPTSKLVKALCEFKEPLLVRLSTNYHCPCDDLMIMDTEMTTSLYISFLYLTSPTYQQSITYAQKSQLIEQLQNFLTLKLYTDPVVGRFLSDVQTPKCLEKFQDEIKQTRHYSDNVVLLMAIVFDLNILVLSSDNADIKHYHSDTTFDDCKPFVVMVIDSFGVYRPVVYSKNTIVNYYDHPLIPFLLNSKNNHVVKRFT